MSDKSLQIQEENNQKETKKNWQAKLNEIQVPKTLINRLVLNFLMIEGYKDGAKKFIKEANIDLSDPINNDLKIDFNEELMDQRMQVRKFILAGRIKDAVGLINEINPQILDKNPDLNFDMKKQQLIEIIKLNKVEEAIKFAQTQIAPTCQKITLNKDKSNEIESSRAEKFQRDLEQTMMLLIFNQFNNSEKNEEILQQLPSSLKNLVDYSNRQRLASQVNQSILETLGYQSEHKLGFYWQMTQWSQRELQKKANQENILASGDSDSGSKKDDIEKMGKFIFPVLNSPMGELEFLESDNNQMDETE